MTWSTPVLMFLYPLAIVLILVALASPLFDRAPVVYRWALGLTLIPACFDLVGSLPPFFQRWGGRRWLTAWAGQHLPLFTSGFAWLPFAVVGTVIGLAVWQYQRYNTGK